MTCVAQDDNPFFYMFPDWQGKAVVPLNFVGHPWRSTRKHQAMTLLFLKARNSEHSGSMPEETICVLAAL